MLLPSLNDLANKNIKAMLLLMGPHRPHNTDGLEPCRTNQLRLRQY